MLFPGLYTLCTIISKKCHCDIPQCEDVWLWPFFYPLPTEFRWMVHWFLPENVYICFIGLCVIYKVKIFTVLLLRSTAHIRRMPWLYSLVCYILLWKRQFWRMVHWFLTENVYICFIWLWVIYKVLKCTYVNYSSNSSQWLLMLGMTQCQMPQFPWKKVTWYRLKRRKWVKGASQSMCTENIKISLGIFNYKKYRNIYAINKFTVHMTE